jgi:hypothetical protein
MRTSAVHLRRSVAQLVVPPLIAGVLALQLGGCAANEARPYSISEPNRLGDDRYPVIRATTGSTVEITRQDGTVLRGRYLGVERMSADEYAQHWAELLGRAPDATGDLPVPGESVTVRARGGRMREARFDGFGYRSIELSDSTGPLEAIAWNELSELRGGGGRSWTGEVLSDSVAGGRLPMILRVRLAVGGGEILVPADQIADSNDRSSSGLATGVFIGFVIVAAAGIAALSYGHSHYGWWAW